jgi:hypothetical protein
VLHVGIIAKMPLTTVPCIKTVSVGKRKLQDSAPVFATIATDFLFGKVSSTFHVLKGGKRTFFT